MVSWGFLFHGQCCSKGLLDDLPYTSEAGKSHTGSRMGVFFVKLVKDVSSIDTVALFTERNGREGLLLRWIRS